MGLYIEITSLKYKSKLVIDNRYKNYKKRLKEQKYYERSHALLSFNLYKGSSTSKCVIGMDIDMKITDETITYVAALAKLDLSADEKDRAKTDLENIISYMDTMNEIDTSNVEPMSHAFPMKNVFREDIVTNGDDRDNLLSNAPVKKDSCFIVPKTVE